MAPSDLRICPRATATVVLRKCSTCRAYEVGSSQGRRWSDATSDQDVAGSSGRGNGRAWKQNRSTGNTKREVRVCIKEVSTSHDVDDISAYGRTPIANHNSASSTRLNFGSMSVRSDQD